MLKAISGARLNSPIHRSHPLKPLLRFSWQSTQAPYHSIPSVCRIPTLVETMSFLCLSMSFLCLTESHPKQGRCPEELHCHELLVRSPPTVNSSVLISSILFPSSCYTLSFSSITTFNLLDFLSRSLADERDLVKRLSSRHQQINQCVFTWTSFPTVLMYEWLWFSL